MANDLSLLHKQKVPPRADTQGLYGQLWSVTGPAVASFERARDTILARDILRPITTAEIERRIGKIAGTSAAGPDGITKGDLAKPDIYVALAVFLNLQLSTQHYPEAWRVNRTTLIPKFGKDLNDVKTVSSMISRIFSGLIDGRLRSVIKQSNQQKGFTEENDCYSNVHLLHAALKQAKNKGGVITVLDVSKAFDMVPQSAIEQCLLRKGILAPVAKYVTGMYKDCQTKIKTDDGEVNILLKRGVTQGDPLSPLIVNLIVEPILE